MISGTLISYRFIHLYLDYIINNDINPDVFAIGSQSIVDNGSRCNLNSTLWRKV